MSTFLPRPWSIAKGELATSRRSGTANSRFAGRLVAIRCLWRRASRHTALRERRSPGEDEVRAFISNCYRHHFGAEIQCDYPQLVAISDRQGNVLAACGIRTAESELFLERYLDAPVNEVLSMHYGESLSRATIAEIGNLASVNSEATPLLFKATWQELDNRQVSHAVITCTRKLKARFRRLPVTSLGKVTDPAMTAAEKACWGSYYENEPELLSAPIDLARPLLRFVRNNRQFGIHVFDCHSAISSTSLNHS